MAKRKKSKKPLSEFDKKYPKEYDDFKAEDEIVYKRISDGKTSIGIIKYFHPASDPVCATVIDLQLGNYQTAIVEEITREPTKELLDKLWVKISSKTRVLRRSPRRGKTKKT